MHLVIARILHLDRQEGSSADMQGDDFLLNSSGLQCFMRSGVKCSPAVGAATAPALLGKDRLVVVTVLRIDRPLRFDIGRQGHSPTSAMC